MSPGSVRYVRRGLSNKAWSRIYGSKQCRTIVPHGYHHTWFRRTEFQTVSRAQRSRRGQGQRWVAQSGRPAPSSWIHFGTGIPDATAGLHLPHTGTRVARGEYQTGFIFRSAARHVACRTSRTDSEACQPLRWSPPRHEPQAKAGGSTALDVTKFAGDGSCRGTTDISASTRRWILLQVSSKRGRCWRFRARVP